LSKVPDSAGRLFDGVLNERDKLHPSIKGYQIWADALKPILRELLGPPGMTDLASPPSPVRQAFSPVHKARWRAAVFQKEYTA
jgi:hypothetical protein